MTDRSTPAQIVDTPAFDPRGNRDQLDDALTSLQKFGSLRQSERELARGEIVKIAAWYNRLCSAAHKGPSRSRIVSDFAAVKDAARRMKTSLENLHDVSLTWLTGDADLEDLPPDAPPRVQRWRALPTGISTDGPSALRDDAKFVESCREAFEPQLLRLGFEIDGREQRAAAARKTAMARVVAAKTEREWAAAVEEYAAIPREFDLRRDLIEPLALQMINLWRVAEMARKELERQWPGGGNTGRADVLALGPPGNRLAVACRSLIMDFAGPTGFGLITQTPDGLFGTLVKDVAAYATGHPPANEEFNAAIKAVARRAVADVEALQARGVDPFQGYQRARARF